MFNHYSLYYAPRLSTQTCRAGPSLLIDKSQFYAQTEFSCLNFCLIYELSVVRVTKNTATSMLHLHLLAIIHIRSKKAHSPTSCEPVGVLAAADCLQSEGTASCAANGEESEQADAAMEELPNQQSESRSQQW